MTEIKLKTAKSLIPVSIKAPVGQVFPLASPVEENKWIPGWKCNLVHCPNDKVELGIIFSEISSAPFLIGNVQGKTTWTVVLHDPETHKIHFRLDNKKSSSLYKIELEDNGKGGTEGKLDFAYHATNKKGEKMVSNHVEERIQLMLSILHSMLKHYCETNNLISSSESQKMIVLDMRMSIFEKILIGLNQVAKITIIDKDRARLMKKFSRV